MLQQNLEERQSLAAPRGHPQAQPRMVTGGQIRAARSLLGWSARELADRAGVSVRTVHSAESAEGTPRIQLRTMERIERAFRNAGIEFLAESQRSNGGGLGLRIRRPSDR
jgi:transcriptional regulator with XRE-family HTH domain